MSATAGSLSAAGAAGDQLANCVARWDGVSWHPYGTGLGGGATSLAALPAGGFAVGGGFRTAGSEQSFSFARFAPIAPPCCEPDFTGDGNTDQDDVECLFSLVAGGVGCSSLNPDFNHDGIPDQNDIAALIHAIAGGGCP